MALRSTKLHEDPHVEFVTNAIEKYLSDFVSNLEKEEDGISNFMREDNEAAWHAYVQHYALSIKHFGLNPCYKKFKNNRDLFIELLENKRSSLVTNYKKRGRPRRFSIFL